MSKVTFLAALIFVLLVDVYAYGVQLGVDHLGGASNYYQYNESFISQYDAGNYTVQEFSSSELPGSASGITTGGEFFTDAFQSMKNWFLDLPGVKQINGLITCVPNLIKSWGLPSEIAFALGAAWHALTVIVIVGFIKS